MKPAERGFHRPRAAGSSPRTQEFTYVQLEIFVWQIRLSFANKAPVCLSRQTMSDSGVYLMLLRASEQVDPRCFPRGLWQDAVLPEAEVNPGPSGSRGGLATTKPTCWRLSGDIVWCRLTVPVQSTVLVPVGLRRCGRWWLPRSLEVVRTQSSDCRAVSQSCVSDSFMLSRSSCWSFSVWVEERTDLTAEHEEKPLSPNTFYCRFCLSAHLSASVLHAARISVSQRSPRTDWD